MANLHNSFFSNFLFTPNAISSQHSFSHNPIPLFFLSKSVCCGTVKGTWLPRNPSWPQAGCQCEAVHRKEPRSSHEIQKCLSMLSGHSFLLASNLWSFSNPCQCSLSMSFFSKSNKNTRKEHAVQWKGKKKHRSWKIAFNVVWGGAEGGGLDEIEGCYRSFRIYQLQPGSHSWLKLFSCLQLLAKCIHLDVPLSTMNVIIIILVPPNWNLRVIIDAPFFLISSI